MLDDIIKERKRKLELLGREGVNPYPSKVNRDLSIFEFLEDSKKFSKKEVYLAGRITGLRDQGNLIFVDIKDYSGRIQGVFKKDNLNNFSVLKQSLDIGDFVSLSGTFFETKAGEKSIEAKEVVIITKSLKPLPTEWYGLKDIEERFRKKYLDLVINPDVKDKINIRSNLVALLREKLSKDGFLEVETPILQPIPGGALARPFKTHHNALGVDFYLRIAPELYLKRLLIGGFEKVFEIGKVFRNEGIDRDHNPEFTELELYWAYQEWNGLMDFIEKILKEVVSELKTGATDYFSSKLKWPRITYAEAFEKYAKIDFKKISIEEIDEIFKKEVRAKITSPVFITHYPKSISPLAKSCEDNSNLTERFQLIIDGTEVVNGFSELNDPIEQRKRMEEQEKMYRAGNEEASRLDEDFLEAIEYGMPPAAGLGIGIDRLAALVTGANNIKEVIIFPTLKPKN